MVYTHGSSPGALRAQYHSYYSSQFFRSTRQRGTHAVVGVGTSDAPLHKVGYCALVGDDEHSWGWDLGRNRLTHNGKQMALNADNQPSMPMSAPPVPRQVRLWQCFRMHFCAFLVHGNCSAYACAWLIVK